MNQTLKDLSIRFDAILINMKKGSDLDFELFDLSLDVITETLRLNKLVSKIAYNNKSLEENIQLLKDYYEANDLQDKIQDVINKNIK